MADDNSIGTEKMEMGDDNNVKLNAEGDTTEILNSSKESEPENLDAIKKFIEDQEKELVEEKEEPKSIENGTGSKDNDASDENSAVNAEATCSDIMTCDEQDALLAKENKLENNNEEKDLEDETMAVASSVMDMILTDSEAKIAKKKVEPLKDSINAGEKGWYVFGSFIA